jgi:16S rRNA processing protein RimM
VTTYVALGKIAGPVGLNGDVRIAPWTDSQERLKRLKHVWIGSDSTEATEFAVDAVRFSGRAIVIKFAGIEDRTAAEQIRDKLVLIPEELVVRPPRGSYFIDDVVVMEVVTEEGKRVGVVLEILRLPSNDLWQVDSGTKTISIPAVKEFIRKVDEKTRTVVIHEIEGLLDL